MGGKKKKAICKECSKAKFPAISAAKLGHENCLVTAYRVLGVFNERDSYGATPIHYAARNGQLECLQWLVAHSGISPVVAAKNGTTAAHDSAAMGHLACLQFLLEKTKCSPHDRTNEGATVLHMACRFGHLEVTRWLVEKGLSSPGDRGDNGVTPVHLCAAKDHLDCLKCLTRSTKYVPNQLTVHGATPVYFAAQEGSLECLRWLVKRSEGDPTIFANDGMAALHAAAQAGEMECLQWLVQHGGVSPSQKAEDGATPMHFAAAGGQMSCLKWLVDNGGSLMDKDDLGGTPLHDAAEQGQTEAVSFILGCGIEKDIPDNEGYTPIDLAKDNNHEDCMKLFYIKTPNLLNSIAPKHPQNRASASDEELLHKEKQRKFEKALLSKTTEKEREEIWKKAKENVPEPRSLELSTLPDNHGNSKRSNRHTSQDSHRLSVSQLTDLIDEHASKERPALTSELFIGPNEKEAELDNKGGGVNEKETDTPTVVVVKGENELGEEVESSKYFAVKKDSSSNRALDESEDKGEGLMDDSDLNPYDEFLSQGVRVVEQSPSSGDPPLAGHAPLRPITNREGGSPLAGPISSSSGGRGKQQSKWKGLFKRLSSKKSSKSKPPPPPPAATSNGGHSKEQKKQSVATGEVVLRQKPKKSSQSNESGADQVFSHRTSREEELAIVTHKRLSTDDNEVAVKFEKRRLASRQSTLSANDEMSSPETSGDEGDGNPLQGEESYEDIFRPITSNSFDKFGQMISRDSNSMVQIIESEDDLLLENRGSLASMDTMVIHEEEEVDGGEGEGGGGERDLVPPVKKESTLLLPKERATSNDRMTGEGSQEKGGGGGRLSPYNEIMVKSSPMPKKRLMLVGSIAEENEEDLMIEDSSDNTNAPITTKGKEKGSTPGGDRLGTNLPVSNNSLLGNKGSGGVRSFAMVKQMYQSTDTAPSFQRIQTPRTQQVYSPLMVVATASPRVSLTSVQEEGEEEKEREDPVTMGRVEPHPPQVEGEENRISLTPSQEAAFDNLEKLKDSLKDSETNKESRVDNATVDYKEAMRTSPAVEELFDMIKGLDDMIKHSNTVTSGGVSSNDSTNAAPTPPDSSDSVSLTGMEVHSLVSTPHQTDKNDARRSLKEVTVSVEVDGVGAVQVAIKKSALVILLLFKAAEAAGVTPTTSLALFEVHNTLRIERALEDHEVVADIMSRWPKKTPVRFHLHTHQEKHILWEDNPLPTGQVGRFLKQGKVPNVASPLHYNRGGAGGRGSTKWSRGIHCLGSLGIYSTSSLSKESSNMDLVCGTDQLLYFPTKIGDTVSSKFKLLPSKHCFVMKPVGSWKEKDLKLFCCEDYNTFNQWISGIRLVKYGLQLKCNYVATQKRLNQLQLATGR